jgi:hypothetical protein
MGARETGLDLDLAAHKLAVKPERLAQWEAGEELPTIRQLLELGRVYRRNPAVFYLPCALRMRHQCMIFDGWLAQKLGRYPRSFGSRSVWLSLGATFCWT